jgi:integrase
MSWKVSWFYPMKPSDTTSARSRYLKVLDGRSQPIRGLWKTRKTGAFYAQLQIDGKTAWIPLPQATTRAQAVDELNKLKTERKEGKLVVVKHAPKLVDAIESFKADARFKDKRASTQRNLKIYFKLWVNQLGQKSVKHIRKADILQVRQKLRNEGYPGFTRGKVSRKTGNHYVEALMQVLKFCEENDQIGVLPVVRREKAPKGEEKPRPEIMDDVQFKRLLAACFGPVPKRRMVAGENGKLVKRYAGETEKLSPGNATLLHNYLRFLALTGARETEAYRVKWSDVDLERGVVTIGSDGLSKSGKPRDVNCSPELEALLRELHASRQPDSSYLFPSPQRGDKDIPLSSIRPSFNGVRLAAGMPKLAFHAFRRLFISKCVMAGVDYKTIASWVDHKDGGILIGNTYSFLTEDHKAATAKRLTFFERPANITDLPQQSAG